MHTLVRISLLAALLAGVAGAVHAQSWPARPIRFILSQTAGTSPDITARLIADRLSRLWGQQVIVDNRGGGQNVIGSQLAARATADGYNYFFATTAAIAMNPFTFKSLPYDPAKDFAPVANIGLSPFVIAVNPGVQAKTLAELIALDKSQPAKLSLANEGPRTLGGVMGQMLNHSAGIKLLQVPYNGVGPAIQDTIAGRTQVILISSAALGPFLKRGDLRALAVTAGRRVPDLDQVPTAAETLRGFEYVGWYALVAPAGTPKAIIERVNRDVDRVLGDAEVKARLRELGLVSEGAGTPASTGEFLKAERERWSKLIRDIGLQPE